MIAREIAAVVEQHGLRHVRLWALPAAWHFTPERIADGVRAEVARARSFGASSVHVGYADCGTGGALDRVCAELGVERLPGPHCFAFYQGADTPAPPTDDRAFYVTDFLARQPDTFLWKPLGLGRNPELRDVYFAHYDRVIYLAQTEDEALLRSARAIAERLDLQFEHRCTGYGDLERILPRWNGSSVANDPGTVPLARQSR